MLKLSHVTLTFPGALRPTLKGISWTLEAGEFCVIIGSNGSGKSSLLKTITGDYPADKGRITLNGVDITPLPIHQRATYISRVTQDIPQGTVPEMTLLENMVLSRLRGRTASLRSYTHHTAEVEATIATLQPALLPYMNQPLSRLSGGQRQLIALGMALCPLPTLLLLDEHTSALDPKTALHLMEYTAHQVHNHTLTTLMVTHNLKDAIAYGNRLIMIHNGNVVMDVSGSAKEALTAPQLLEAFHHYTDKDLEG